VGSNKKVPVRNDGHDQGLMRMQAPSTAGEGGRLGRYLLVGSEKVVRIPLGILVSGMASRALGVEDFGQYTSVLVLLTVMTPLASFGLESLGIAMASKSAGPADYLRDAGPFRCLTGAGAAVLFLATSATFFASDAGEVTMLALLAVGSIFCLRTYELCEHLLLAQERLATLAAVRICCLLVATLVVLLVLLGGGGVSELLMASAVESMLLLALYAVLFQKDIVAAAERSSADPKLRRAWEQCRTAFPVFASGLLVLLLLNADKLLVFRYVGASESGLYNAAAKLVDVLYFIPMAIGSTHAAGFSRMAQDGTMLPEYRRTLLVATRLSAAAAIVLAAFAPWIVTVVYGESFAAAAQVLRLLAPGLVAVTWVSLRTRALAALDDRNGILRLTLLACALHFPLLAAGLWVGSAEAVAFCQTVGWMMAALVVPLVSRTSRDLSPWHPFGRRDDR
jgi:PST family polysaccharide transporter